MGIRTKLCPNCCVQLVFEQGVNQVKCKYCRGDIWWSTSASTSSLTLDEGDRLCNEMRFEDAIERYKSVLQTAPDNTRALWGMIKATYGVQIVCEDGTNKRYLICHIRNMTRVQSHPYYTELMKQNLTPADRKQYEQDAAYIDRCQEEIELLARDGTQWDVYLCYKETERLTDGTSVPSVDKDWVREVYQGLKSKLPKDLNVFYAPEALYGLSGASYAAGIANALSTSRVMLLLCSRADYLDTTWVKSEYERFLRLIDREQLKRRVIPVYRSSLGMKATSFPSTILEHRIQCIDFEQDRESFYQLTANQIEKQLQIPDSRDRYRKDQKRLEDLQKEITAVKAQLDERTKEAEKLLSDNQILNDLRKQAEQKLASAESKVTVYLEQVSDSFQRWTEEKQLRTSLEKEKEKLKAEQARLMKQLEESSLTAQEKQRENAVLQKEAEALQRDLDAQKARLQGQQGLTEEAEGLRKQIDVLQDALEKEKAVTQTIPGLHGENSALQQKVSDLQFLLEAEKEKSGDLEKVTSERNELKKQLTGLKTRLDDGARKLEEAAREKEALEKKVNELQTSFNSESRKASEAVREKEALENKVQELEKLLEKATKKGGKGGIFPWKPNPPTSTPAREPAPGPRFELVDFGFYSNTETGPLMKENPNQVLFPSKSPIRGVYIQTRSRTGKDEVADLYVVTANGQTLFQKKDTTVSVNGTVTCFPVSSPAGDISGFHKVVLDGTEIGKMSLRLNKGSIQPEQKQPESPFALVQYGFLAKYPDGRMNKYPTPLKNNKYYDKRNIHHLYFILKNQSDSEKEISVKITDGYGKVVFLSTPIHAYPGSIYRFDTPFEGEAGDIHQMYTISVNNMTVSTVELDGRYN